MHHPAPLPTADTAPPPVDLGPGNIMLNAPLLEQIAALAVRMASSSCTLPKHLQKNEGDCYAVAMQAVQWRMNPWVVAQKTHLVNGTLGYEAQLVNAVVQSSGMIQGTFRYEYRGEGEALACRVGATLTGDTDVTWGEWLALGSVTIRNSPLWKTNPRQQLGYLQVKNFSRAYCPAAILGVYTPDELQALPPAGDRGVEVPSSALNAALREDAPKGEIIDGEVERADDAAAPPPAEAQHPLSYAQIADQLHQARTLEALQACVEGMADFLGTADNEQYREELADLYRHRLAQLRTDAPGPHDADKD